MPIDISHPLVRARVAAGMGAAELARETGLHRSTISAIEEGRSREVTPDVAVDIDRALGRARGTLAAEMAEYNTRGHKLVPSVQQRSILLMSPTQLHIRFTTFSQWREIFAPTPTSFASLLRVNRAVVDAYESGRRKRGMSQALTHAIMDYLEVPYEYVLALGELETGR